jgi:hypothetical protein
MIPTAAIVNKWCEEKRRFGNKGNERNGKTHKSLISTELLLYN